MSFKTSKLVLSEADKDRLLCVLLNSTLGKTDWDTAATEYGSASTNSFKVMYGVAMKKIKKAEETNKRGVSQMEEENDYAPSPPAKKAKKAKAKKVQSPPPAKEEEGDDAEVKLEAQLEDDEARI